MRFFSPFFLAGWLYPEAIFRLKTTDKILCLTFDDGPDPESTSKLLEILEKYKIRALFFCDGKAAELYPLLVNKIKEKGHLIGNHGYKHLNGWATSLREYCNDVNYASRFTSGKIFRPPFGFLRLNQYRKLSKSFKIVFWDIMPYDFDRETEAAKSLKILNKKIRPGSVIVLHDSQDSSSVLFLDEFLDNSVTNGYKFTIPEFQ